MILYHGSTRADLTRADITTTRTTGKHCKPGRTVAGFYCTPVMGEAAGYAAMGEGVSTVYVVAVSTRAAAFEYQGDITRIPADVAANLLAAGFDVLTGRDPRGRLEVVVINPEAITHLERVA